MNSGMFPPVSDSRHLGLGDVHGVLRAGLACDHADEHPRDDVAVEHFHSNWICIAGESDVPRPVGGVLQLGVLAGRVGLGVFREPDDEVGNRFLESWKVAAARFFVGSLSCRSGRRRIASLLPGFAQSSRPPSNW